MSVECSVKIAQIAPLIESVPPRFYGGTERVVSYLTEELVRSGHEVTLFASGDSVTSAQLDLAPPELEGVGQKHVGTGQIDACHSRCAQRTRA